MDVTQYIEIYHRIGLKGLNDSLVGKTERDLVDLLAALEKNGFEVLWHRDQDVTGGRDFGVIVGGPDRR